MGFFIYCILGLLLGLAAIPFSLFSYSVIGRALLWISRNALGRKPYLFLGLFLQTIIGTTLASIIILGLPVLLLNKFGPRSRLQLIAMVAAFVIGVIIVGERNNRRFNP